MSLKQHIIIWLVITALILAIVFLAFIVFSNPSPVQPKTENIKPTQFLTQHFCPEGYAAHTIKYPDPKNMSWITSCSNQGVWIQKTFMAVDEMIPVQPLNYNPIGMYGVMNHDDYGQFIEDFKGNRILNLVPSLNITDGHIIQILNYTHYQPKTCYPSILVLTNNTIIHDANLVKKIIANQTGYGLTPMDYGLTSNEQDACTTYATYKLEDMNSTKYAFTIGLTKDG